MRKLITLLGVALISTTAVNAQNYFYGYGIPNSSNQGQQNNNNYGTAWLIEKCTSSAGTILTAVDSATIDSGGSFQIPYRQPSTGCHFLLKAAFNTSSNNYANYLPTYYANGANPILWSNAPHTDTPGYYLFWMRQGTNPGGPGFVGGNVLQGANKGTAVGDPLEGRIMILTDMSDNAVAYTYTDANGEFSFSNIAHGSYKLFGDKWGRNNPALYVTVDANNENINNIVFEENDTDFKGRYVWATNVTNVNSELSKVSVFPNPVQGQINIDGLNNISGDKVVTITSVTGAVIFNQTYNEGQQVSISANDMAAGLYMLEVQTTVGNKTFKLVK